MKILLNILILIVVFLVILGYGTDTEENEQAVATPAPSPGAAAPTDPFPFPFMHDLIQMPPSERPQPPNDDWSEFSVENAEWLLSRLDEVLKRDNGTLWGVNLRAPFMIVNAFTRDVVANMPDNNGNLEKQGDVYTGTLHETALIGTTATKVYDRWWGMMTWGFIDDFSDDLDYVVQVMVHELFHAWQFELFEGERRLQNNAHMDELDARISVRMEVNALMKALEATGFDRLAAIKDALSIRAERRRNFDSAALEENLFEISEGTAVYTDLMLTININELRNIITYMELFIEKQIHGQSMRTFGYTTGALYGFLLDELGADWKQGLRFDSDLGVLLQEAAGISELTPFENLDLELYGYSEITAFETEWLDYYERLLREANEIFNETLLRITSDGEIRDWNPDYAQVLHLQGREVAFYGRFSFKGDFGRLIVNDGFLLLGRTTSYYEISARNIETEGNRLVGLGWVIELNDDYELREAGDFYYIDKS